MFFPVTQGYPGESYSEVGIMNKKFGSPHYSCYVKLKPGFEIRVPMTHRGICSTVRNQFHFGVTTNICNTFIFCVILYHASVEKLKEPNYFMQWFLLSPILREAGPEVFGRFFPILSLTQGISAKTAWAWWLFSAVTGSSIAVVLKKGERRDSPQPGGCLAMSRDISDGHSWREVLLASGG